MIEYRRASKDDLKEIAAFIADINVEEENHIGYCGIDADEIAEALIKDLTDLSFHESFIIAMKDRRTIGVMGFDIDMTSGIAEIWGPFIEKDSWGIINELWTNMLGILPKETRYLNLFINKKNKAAISWGEAQGFRRISEESILTIGRDRIEGFKDMEMIEISEKHYEAMKLLHDTAFPNGYYSGQEIINRLSHYKKVFIIYDASQLLGYIYAEVKEEHGEGSIEFFAVNQTRRGKGFGRSLLKMALKWIFSFPMIDNVSLCVNSQNHKAIKLYKEVGFTEKHLLYLYKKRIN